METSSNSGLKKKLVQLEPVNRRLLNQVQSSQVEVEIFRVEQPQENTVEESELDEMDVSINPFQPVGTTRVYQVVDDLQNRRSNRERIFFPKTSLGWKGFSEISNVELCRQED